MFQAKSQLAEKWGFGMCLVVSVGSELANDLGQFSWFGSYEQISDKYKINFHA